MKMRLKLTHRYDINDVGLGVDPNILDIKLSQYRNKHLKLNS